MSVHGLFIGINAYPRSPLKGCVNDARDMATAFSFADSSRVLLDKQATRRGTLASLSELLGQLRAGDWGIITFSGHGTWIADANGDEPDGRDEALVCADLELIVDDEFADLLSIRPAGARLFVVTDSCHSGTVHRFLAAAGTQQSPASGQARFLPPASIPPAARRRAINGNRKWRQPTLPGVIHFAGCRDYEYSYDATIRGRANGAMTRALLDTLGKLRRGGTFDQWFQAVSKKLPTSDWPQHPTANASRSSLAAVVPRQ